jgi:uncharacterized protein YjdB
MKNLFKKVAILLCMVLIAPTVLNCLPSVHNLSQVEAASKAKLYSSKGKTGINSSPEYIYIENQKDSAKYTYTSSNKKVATVNKYGQVTGKSKGSAKITVNQLYKGKTTKVGTYSVSVVYAKLYDKQISMSAMGRSYPYIEYMNKKATYTGVSSDPTIVSVDKDGNLVGLKAGTATVTFTETYKKVKREVGSLSVTVNESSINSETSTINFGVGATTSYFQDYFSIDNQSWDATYTFESADSAIVSTVTTTDEYGYKYTTVTGVSVGTTTLTLYEEFDGTKRTVGQVTVNVVEIPLTGFEIDSWYTDNGALSLNSYLGDEYPTNLSYYLIKTPYDATTPITYTSSDATILTVNSEGIVNPLKAGSVVVTATCGTFSVKITINVVDESLDW